MKQIGLVLMLLLSSLLITAQSAGDKPLKDHKNQEKKLAVETRQAKELEQLTKQLTLTPEQQASIVELQGNMNNAAKASHEAVKGDPDRKAKREQMMLLRKEYDTNLMALLTPVQKKKYEAILKARQEQQQRQNVAKESPNMGQDAEGGDE